MPVQSSFLEYHKSIANELNATKDRIRQLIGSRHWLTDGEHKEAVLRKILRNQLPELVRVGRGFVCFSNESSHQIDILIIGRDKPTLFRDEELILVTPDAVESIIEVKTVLNDRMTLRKALSKLSKDISRIRSNHNPNCLAGLFIYDESHNRIEDRVILEELKNAANAEPNKVINWIAFGPDRFFRFWKSGDDVASLFNNNVWHSYELTHGLAHAYFVSNVTWDVTEKRGIAHERMQYAWFPVEGGKEGFRRWCIPLSDGIATQF